jgi:tetratricopeptide (TPR) repeat protein
MEINTINQAKTQTLIDKAIELASTLHKQGRYQEALDICLQLTRNYPKLPVPWVKAAVNCFFLDRAQDVIRYGQTALALGSNALALYDVLTHVYGHLGQWDEVRRYGLQALNARDRRFGSEPAPPLPTLPPMPPPPCTQTRECNLIVFSLFGDNSKYCEPAILNVQEQPGVYPNWICRFYVDGSVPESVINRLRAGGGQIVRIEGTTARQWPGPMWRLLALDDPLAQRILFRDADSVISQREAAAVEQWISSGKRFHIMRDWYSHTELIMAGLWGVVSGSLPLLDGLMSRFMSAPLESRHFADQYFLREYVWPYARSSLMQHDSIFGFMDAVPFPTEKAAVASGEGSVGYCEGSYSLTTKTNLPDGSKAVWELYLIEKLDGGELRGNRVCSYTNTVQNSTVKVYVPMRYARRIQQGTAGLRLVESGAA